MNCWLQVTSGRGPDECCWVVARMVEEIIKDASAKGLAAQALEVVSGSRLDLFQSALISIEGENLQDFISQWQGTIQWIGRSQFRPHHKRKNWFVGVDVYQAPEETRYNMNEFKFESMRASGPGGQHVNKTESAVRVTHLPTGISVTAREERSQHMNRRLALSRICEKLEQQKNNAATKLQQERWDSHNELERGNPVRVYQGANFKLKKSL